VVRLFTVPGTRETFISEVNDGSFDVAVQEMAFTSIVCELAWPIDTVSIPFVASAGAEHLKPDVARQTLFVKLCPLNTPSWYKAPRATATTSIARPYVTRYSIEDCDLSKWHFSNGTGSTV
jgi:hypothetical protein